MMRFVAALFALHGFGGVVAQLSTYPATPLASKRFPTPSDAPYKVDTDTGLVRGSQLGYNICNSITENQDSLCQTFYMNDITDFCLTAPTKPDSYVADEEGEMVAWCLKKGHGTRVIPAGAITGIEFRKTPDYIQIVGFIDQVQIDINKFDFGGEMDPGGADGRGNPLGGLVYSSAFTGSPIQVIWWNCFVGGGMFACKACDPRGQNDSHYCEHIYDRIGIAYNAPNNAQQGVFVSCDADSADFPGVYTSNGQVMTYTQPPESLGAITTMPYFATVPPVSNCKTYSSEQLYSSLTASSSSSTPTHSGPSPTTTVPSGTLTPSSTPTGKATTTSNISVLETITISGSDIIVTTTPGTSVVSSLAPTARAPSGAESLAFSGLLSIFGTVFAALFLS